MKHSPFKVSFFRVWCIYRYRKRTVLLLIANITRGAFQNIIATNHEKIMTGWNATLTNYLFQVLICNRWHGWKYITLRPWPSIISYLQWKIEFDLSLQTYCIQLIGFTYTNLGYFFFSGIIWPVHQCTLQTSSESMGSTWSRVFWNYNSKNVTIGKFLFLSSSRFVHDSKSRVNDFHKSIW